MDSFRTDVELHIVGQSTNLAKTLVQVGQGPGDDASVTVVFSATRDGEGLSTASLPISKDSAIVTCQHTEHRYTTRLTQQ